MLPNQYITITILLAFVIRILYFFKGTVIKVEIQKIHNIKG